VKKIHTTTLQPKTQIAALVEAKTYNLKAIALTNQLIENACEFSIKVDGFIILTHR
jgi:hypothetical protein